MSVNIRSFAAMNHSVVETLWGLGFRTNEDVLARTASSRQRLALSREAKLEEHLLHELARRADLARVKGIGNLYAVLLKHAGVFGIQDLAEKDAEKLHASLLKLNSELKISRRIPKLVNIEQWVEDAAALEPVIRD